MEMHGFAERIRGREVLLASFVLAAASMLLVPPSGGYADYIDIRTLCILACMMAVIAGMADTGAFEKLASDLVRRSHGIRGTCAVLVALPFLMSMLITNDVSLLTFVPFGIVVLERTGNRRLMIPVIVLQTAAANLGSSLTPFGNPQNIFISSFYGPDAIDFLTVMAPIVAAGAAVLVLLALRLEGEGSEACVIDGREADARYLALTVVLFAICVAAVLRAVPYQYAAAIVIAVIAATRPRVLLKVDWGLILTFVFLFVFTGNMASLEVVRDALGGLMAGDAMLCPVIVSQFVSNVPAAVMLSGFTDDWQSLLAGVSIGGFGTPIASMASVISLEIYSRTEGSDRKGFLVCFTAVNALMLLVLVPLGIFLRQRRFFLASGLYALRYFRTAWSSSESVHSGVYPPFMYSLYHRTH